MRNLPITGLGRVLRLDGCQKQKNMCWGYDGFVLAHKDVNPDFDEGKPFIIVIDHDGVWQMHFENFGTMSKNEKILDDMYKAVAASCKKGMELELRGGATPGGLSGFSKLQNYGFRKEPLPDNTSVYWGGELDQAKLEKWLNSGRHDDDFLVRIDGDVEPGVEGGVFVSPREYSGEITAGNTKPRPFKMVRESDDEARLKCYCRPFSGRPIRISESGRPAKNQEYEFNESRNTVVPPKKWYSQITPEMVQEYWSSRYIPEYFAEVLNGSTSLDEMRDDLLSFVPGYEEDRDAGWRVVESASERAVKSRERGFNEQKTDRQIHYWAHMLDECDGV